MSVVAMMVKTCGLFWLGVKRLFNSLACIEHIILIYLTKNSIKINSMTIISHTHTHT